MSGLVGSLAGPALFPFALAAAVMAGLVAVEAISLLLGQSLSGLVDGALGHDGGGDLVTAADAQGSLSPAALMSWINLGRVPFLILLILGLAVFALAGFVLQGLAAALLAPCRSSRRSASPVLRRCRPCASRPGRWPG
ncbi:hypothetical protein [Methylobacterium aquaticum]|uniref:hypothetical protein n=1 Tax=Methylobacterium aquaticum TaxID=270351 RepID=UPI003D7C183C